MITQQRSARSAASLLVLAACGITAVTACESGSYNGGNANADGGVDPLGMTDGGVCPLPEAPDGGFPEYDGFASGSVTAPGVHARFCNARVELMKYVYSGPYANVQLGINTSSLGAASVVDVPADGVSGAITLSFGIEAAAPGVYTSADPGMCGQVQFSYATLPSPAVDCDLKDDANPYTCPTGCTQTTFCSGSYDASAGYYSCCVPLAKTFVYQASSAGSCQGTQGAPVARGSWTLTLTSVTPFTGDAGYGGNYATFYEVHGTFTGSLQGAADTTDTADLSLSF